MKKLYTGLTCFLLMFLVACRAQLPGCTDPLSNNYDPKATLNDGSCTYDPVSVVPISSIPLSEELAESSGLILWGGLLWTHNDDTDTRIYGLDTTTFTIEMIYNLEGVQNLDWEEISQDREYVYLGDCGNNYRGNRTDLHILRIEKGSLQAELPVIDTIWFFYEDQIGFNPTAPNRTKYDCEAFVVTADSIFLFTKQWVDYQTTVYSMPKSPGIHKAGITEQYDVEGLVTGATLLDSSNLVVLCGYSTLMQPFIYLLYDYRDNRFFSGNKRRIELTLQSHQIEGIETGDGLTYYLSGEAFIVEPVANNQQKMHIFDLNEYVEAYLSIRK